MKAGPMIAAGLLVVVLGGTAGGLLLFKKRQHAAAEAQHSGGGAPPEPVATTLVGTARWQPTSELVGTTFALQYITLSNEISGVVREVGFDSGQVVDTGHVLLVLDDSTERADLAAAQASVRVAEASVTSGEVRIRLAESNLNRLTRALAAKAVSDSEVDTARAELDRARADLERTRSEVDQAKSRVAQVQVTIDKKTIRAPFKSRAGIRTVHPGQYLAEGSSVVSLQGIADRIYLDFAVPQEYAQQAVPGMRVMAESKMLGDEPVPIEVVALDATVNLTTRNVRIRGLIDNPGERLRPGMSVDVRVPVGASREYAVVPTASVRRASFGDHVFVIGPGKQPGMSEAKQRLIKTGPLIGSDQIVLEGLKPGEKIAAAGSFKLYDGAVVIDLGSGGGKGGNAPGNASKGGKPEDSASR